MLRIVCAAQPLPKNPDSLRVSGCACPPVRAAAGQPPGFAGRAGSLRAGAGNSG